MIERIVEALAHELREDTFGDFGDDRTVTVDGVIDLRNLARAMLKAILDPTDEMKDLFSPATLAAYRRVIVAALNGQPGR